MMLLTTSIAYTILLFQVVNSSLTFTSNPKDVQVPVTSSLHMRCSLNESSANSPPLGGAATTTTASTGLVGRRAAPGDGPPLGHILAVPDTDDEGQQIAKGSSTAKRSQSSASDAEDPVLHLASLTISRDGQQVATVSSFTSAFVESDEDKPNLRVTGDVSGTTKGELGYLDLVWSFPTDVQTGSYECKAFAFTKLGHGVTFSQSLTVGETTVAIDDVIRELQSLKKVVYEQNVTLVDQRETMQSTIDQHQAEIESLNKVVNEQNVTMIKQRKEMQSEIDQHQSKICSLEKDVHEQNITFGNYVKELRHVETGWLDCDGSSRWSTDGTDERYHTWNYFYRQKRLSASFHTDYVTPPVVFLSVSNLFVESGKRTKYGVQLLDVNKQGFSIRCGTDESSNDHIYDIEVTWIAIPK